MDDVSTHVMTDEECWEFLSRREFGRLAFHLAEEVHIVPVNYAVDTAGEGRTLLFRTAPGSKLLGVVMNADVAFETDEYDAQHASSVIIRGRTRVLGEDEAHRADNVPLRPWVEPDAKYEVVEVAPTAISGRRFDLSRPWLHMLPD